MSITAKTINLVFSRDASTSKRAPLASFLSLFASDKTFLILMLCSVFTLYKSSTGQVLVPLCFTLNISHSYAVFRFHTAQELHQLVSCPSLLQIKHLSFLCCVPFSHRTRAPLVSFLSLFASHKTSLNLMPCSVFTPHKSSTSQFLVSLCSFR